MREMLVMMLALLIGACGRDRDRSDAEITFTTPSAKTLDGMGRNSFYRCGDLELSAEFPGDDTVKIMLEDRLLTLERVYSASGAKYADGAGNEFWTKDGAMLTLAGQPMRKCTRHKDS